MKLDPQEIEARFRRHAVRVTRQRAAIYAALAETTSHPTAEDLYRTVSERRGKRRHGHHVAGDPPTKKSRVAMESADQTAED